MIDSALDALLNLIDEEDPFGRVPTSWNLPAMQLEAANERFQQRRSQIAVLDHRAREFGIDQIRSDEDLVPLLFAHSVYKSYPESFLRAERWDRLTLWLNTVVAADVAGVDVGGIADLDDWVVRLAAAGYPVVASSGTSGKQSFLLMSAADLARSCDISVLLFGFPHKVDSDVKRPVTLLAPGRAPMRYSFSFQAYCEAFGRPDAVGSLTDEPMRLVESIEIARLRRAMVDGSITPEQLSDLEKRDRERAAKAEHWIEDLTTRILSHRDEPQLLVGPWATFWRVLENARARGVGEATFHPGTVASISGGLKGLVLPEDYEDQMRGFLGDVHRPSLYGMSELSTAMPMCEEGVYHLLPWMHIVVVDESGEKLSTDVDDSGAITGRVALFDPVWEARWGGIVGGDRATVRHAPCSCGRSGPTVDVGITRYSDLVVGDDKLTCGGTIEQYIRGVVAE